MLKLRRFEEADAPAVRELDDLALATAGAHLGSGRSDDDLNSIHATYLDGGGEFLVGELDGRLVAMGAVRHVTETVGELKRMRVHPSYQRRGFGHLLLARLEQRAVDLGFRRLRLDATVMQTAAHRLYEGSGYRVVGRGQLAGVDVVYFAKTLV